MRAEITSFIENTDRKERRLLKSKPLMDALSTVDARLPANEEILSLAFNRNMSNLGVLVLTETRLLFVGQSVQVWNLTEVDKITSDNKEYFAFYPKFDQPKSWHISNGIEFIVTLTDVLNEQKFGAI